MTTCLDANVCPNIMYNVICNFKYGIDEYACNPQTTCMRADGKYDCCGKNIVTCLVYAESLLVPTIQPSIAISETICDKICSKIIMSIVVLRIERIVVGPIKQTRILYLVQSRV